MNGLTVIEATWFHGQGVRIVCASSLIGGSFQWRDKSGGAVAYDGSLCRFMRDKIAERPGSILVDVGASVGSFTLLPVLVDCKVIAFEPNPLARTLLRENIAVNGIEDRVRVYSQAVSDYNGKARLLVPADKIHAAVACLSDGVPRSRGFEWEEIDVYVMRLDSCDIERCDFLKVDTEGNELAVLKGAQGLLRKWQPGILFEYQALNTRQFGYEPEEIVAYLNSLGYNHFERVGMEDMWGEVRG